MRATQEVIKGLNTLSLRNLSLKGKVLLINTLILSKVWYLATVYPISIKEEQIIRKHIFAYLWNGENKNPITQDQVFQTLEMGGLGLKNPAIQQKALQLKFIEQITDPKNSAPWLKLARYWIGFNLAPIKEQWSFLRLNNYPKYNYARNTLTEFALRQHLSRSLHQAGKCTDQRPTHYKQMLE